MVLLRLTALALILGLLSFYAYVALRSEPRLTTIAFLPTPVASFFDINPLSRNFPAFAVVGFLGAVAVTGLSVHWQVASLTLCLLAPILKDVVQVFSATRHFSLLATSFGIVGALAGWAFSRWLMSRLSGGG